MIHKCLFTAAGYGTRFLPATKSIPKEMLPIVDKPLIQYGVEEAIEAGLTQIAIVSGRGKRALEDHFDISYELEHQISGTPKEGLLEQIRYIINSCTFSYTRQQKMRGLGHAILAGETLIGAETFGLVLADDLCINYEQGVLQQMVDLYAKYQCSIVAIKTVPLEQTANYGIVMGEEIAPGLIQVEQMVEKPMPHAAPSNLAIVGRYILTPDLFEIMRSTPPGFNHEIQLTDAMNTQAAMGKVLAYKFIGEHFDCGSIEGFVQATNYIYNNYHPGIGSAGK